MTIAAHDLTPTAAAVTALKPHRPDLTARTGTSLLRGVILPAHPGAPLTILGETARPHPEPAPE